VIANKLDLAGLGKGESVESDKIMWSRDVPGDISRVFQVVIMLIGCILMLFGCLLVIRNREIAVYTGTAQRGYHSQFSTSAARQNIAIVGALLFGAGLAAFIFL
jgi:hypothetical protein